MLIAKANISIYNDKIYIWYGIQGLQSESLEKPCLRHRELQRNIVNSAL